MSDLETTTKDAGSLGIHKAICEVKLALASGGGIGKGRHAPAGAGGFAFRGIEDFDNILCGLTAEHNIAGPYPRIISKEVVHGTTAKGGYQCHVFLEVEWTYVCSLDGSRHVASTMGEAMDTQDKACNKAMQAARKYADVMVFRIPVGGDDTESVYVPAVDGPPQQPAQQQPTELPRGPLLPAGEQPRRTRGPNKPKDQAPAQQTQAEQVPPGYPITNAGTVTVPAEITHPAAVLNGNAPAQHEEPFPNGAGPNVSDSPSILQRIFTTNTFGILYAIAQDIDASLAPNSPALHAAKDALVKRASHLFSVATDMKGVQEGFELVSALGQPAELKAAANKAYGKFRQ